jgi:DNA-binding NarL/FixJ family response regulator
VDDYQPLRQLLTELLTPRGIEVVGEASEGGEALDVLEQTTCDIVVMDLNMPGMNGLDATKAIHERHPDVRVVAFTSTDDPPAVRSLLDAGAAEHFHKLDMDGLIEYLATAAITR